MTTVVRFVNRSPNENCELDPVPTWPVQQFAGERSPFIAALSNASLYTVTACLFPTSRKCAVITPVLKQSALHLSDGHKHIDPSLT